MTKIPWRIYWWMRSTNFHLASNMLFVMLFVFLLCKMLYSWHYFKWLMWYDHESLVFGWIMKSCILWIKDELVIEFSPFILRAESLEKQQVKSYYWIVITTGSKKMKFIYYLDHDYCLLAKNWFCVFSFIMKIVIKPIARPWHSINDFSFTNKFTNLHKYQ